MAARLRIAQPALSQQICALERQPGMPLVHRTSPGCTLTEVGAQVADGASRPFADVNAAARSHPRPGARSRRTAAAGVHPVDGGRVDALVPRLRATRPDIGAVAESA
ncbi:LysR family transcriptional regulator [Micromonospora sp. DT31]|uniref:LysR family transcriptional regulator n=1 Tax=Micromonospora sp. DT31 TaxID=3393434 RepID=UPI003CF6C0D3